MMYKQVIVVEGYHDEQKIKSIYPHMDCIVTNGSEISLETLNLIYETSFKKEVILFLDPDFPGKQITNKILATKGNYKLAYINKDKARNDNNTKIGVEHANKADIKESLDKLLSIDFKSINITRKELWQRGIINNINSAKLRSFLCDKLNIPFANGKTLLKYLNMLNVKIERIDDLIYEFKS